MSGRKFSFLSFKISFGIACFSFLVRFFFLPQELCRKLTKCQFEIEAVKGKILFFRDVLKLEKMNVKKKIY